MGFEKGNKLGKGRPPKVEEETKIEFVKTTLMESQRGQLFIAEHIFGKPKETIEATHNINDFNIKDIFKIGNKSE